ncbi:uncharacterized protein LOC117121654 [Anneissia japonica]|uniref:uncharacterized protein LOC117121654 n=1 Tax=Anneissia japonica TaxID=1529436 RepID=UPI0014259A8B|nr:uncharacterized protein LOC117121654 [Anneissia japonica]
MAGAKNTQQSSTLVTVKLQTLLTISILINVFYVEPNNGFIAGRSIDSLVADNLRVNEGDSAVLPCFFSPSNAHIGKWYWKTNGTVIIRSDDPPKTNSRYSLGDSTSGNVSLIIKVVLRWDKGTYTCGVNDQSTGSTVPHSDDSKLTVNYLDKPKIQALTDTRIPEGTRVSMSCKVVSSFPVVSLLRWFHEGDIIDSASGKYIVSDEILEIKKFDQRDEGNYSCRAENEYFFGKNGKYSNSITFSLSKKGHKEALDFKKDKKLTVARGECIEASFTSTYTSEHSCFTTRSGHDDPFFIMLLHSCEWPNNTLLNSLPLYSSEKVNVKTTGKIKVNGRILYSSTGKPYSVKDKGNTEKDNKTRGSIKFSFEMKKHVTDGATGSLIFNNVTDDDEGQYMYSLKIVDDICQADTIYRSNVDKTLFISPIGIVLSDQVYSFALKTGKGKEGQSYIKCVGKPQSENKNIKITWNDVAEVILKPEEELLSFVALPGLEQPYIILGYINVSKDRRILGKMFSLLPDGSFKIIKNIFENLKSEGPIEIFKFDPHSGKKLSNGRLVVGGWIKRGYQKRKLDVEKQSCEYEPFIMWTDDEINWNLGENLKIEEAKENMRIQVTETGNGKRMVVIISSLDAKKVLYEGRSYDYCTTFTSNTKDWKFKMPVVSFAILGGSLVCASSMECMETSVPHDGEEEGSSENARKENLPKTGWSMLSKIRGMFTYPLSFYSGESSSKSTKNYESVPTIKATSTNNDNSMENATEEGSPDTNTLSEKPIECSVEEVSENIKKRRSLGKFAKKVTNKFTTKSKEKSRGSESAIQSESAFLTEESTLNKEESTENTRKKDSSETNKQEDEEEITATIEESLEDSMEGSSEKVKNRRLLGIIPKKVTKKLPTKSEGESSGSKLTKQTETSEIEVASMDVKAASSQTQDRSTWEGLWHLEQDTTNDKAIRLRPVKDNDSLGTTDDFVTILENRSKVQCEQILPFTCKGKSWFLMIYKTHYINDKDDEQNHSLCTRYHVFSLDKIMGGK